MNTLNKRVIGRTDIADFPALNLKDIDIKIDTGAYTSSIHCKNIVEKDNILFCEFLDPDHPNYNNKTFTFEEFETARVKSSNGMVSIRYAIKSNITLFEKTYTITLTLNDRNDMRFPVLIGRKFLSKKFLVDPELTNLSHNLKH